MRPALPLHRVERGEAGRVLRELRAQDFVFTVLEKEMLTNHYCRIRCAGNGFLRRYRSYPTMWVRLWFADSSNAAAGHQRAYTLVDADASTDTFWLEFSLHDGAAAQWARGAMPGEQIEASLYGSEPTLPEQDDVDVHLLVGDTASLPAINSLLDALSAPPAVIVLEWVHDDDRHLPVRARPDDRVRWVQRQHAGESLLAAAREELDRLHGPQRGAPESPTSALTAPSGARPRVFAWGACDTVTTRALTKMLRSAGLPRADVKTLGYWLPSEENAALAG